VILFTFKIDIETQNTDRIDERSERRRRERRPLKGTADKHVSATSKLKACEGFATMKICEWGSSQREQKSLNTDSEESQSLGAVARQQLIKVDAGNCVCVQ
jgi:hypothetical protein